MRLKEYTLSANTGLDAIKRAPILDTPTDLRCIRITDISQNNDFEDWGYTEVSPNDYKKFRLKKNDILVARTGATVGVSYIVKDDFNAVYNNGTIRLNLKDNVDTDFIYHLFQTKSFRDYIDNISCVATQPNLRIEGLLKFDIPDISYDTQLKISKCLNKYNELIKLNNKRIKLLEQTAQEIYKEWFVRFRFPGYEKIKKKASSIGKIPETFNVVKMNEVILDSIGGGWGEEDYSEQYPQEGYVIRGADFPYVSKGDMSSCPFRYHKQSNYDARQLKENDIIIEISGGTQEQPVGRTVLITKGMLDKLENKVICASFCKRITLNEDIISPYFFYYWTQFLYDTRMIDRFQLQSTGIINFKFEYFLKKGDCLLPPKPLMNGFENEVRNIKKQIDLLASENANLIKQRDYLLPRLMSGKLEV